MLARALLAGAGPAAKDLRKRKDLDEIAADLVARGQSAWPRVKIEPEAFLEHVGRCLAGAAAPPSALDELDAADLWLAFGAARRNKVAVDEVARRIQAVVEVALSRMQDKIAPDDVAQVLRERLLVGKNGRAKILDYSGRGRLAGWLRIAAVRAAISMQRRGDANAVPVTRETLLAGAGSSEDPELDHFRKRYARDFRDAFAEALTLLSVEERNFLRLSIVDGLSIDEIGGMFRLHRATAARRLVRAREAVQRETTRILRERLAVGTTELRSIAALVRSQLDLSLERLFGPEAGGGATPAPSPRPPRRRRPAKRRAGST
jgi:RNA polymerase sigma-70 factor (ECF subfamily)